MAERAVPGPEAAKLAGNDHQRSSPLDRRLGPAACATPSSCELRNLVTLIHAEINAQRWHCALYLQIVAAGTLQAELVGLPESASTGRAGAVVYYAGAPVGDGLMMSRWWRVLARPQGGWIRQGAFRRRVDSWR